MGLLYGRAGRSVTAQNGVSGPGSGGRALAATLDTSGADGVMGGGGKLLLSLGAAGAGLPWHTHHDNWLELLRGEKCVRCDAFGLIWLRNIHFE